LTAKLDYLQDLGITALWLLPFYPSPRQDDGYDIADYTNIHPAYGTLRDFKGFLREAHRRGLRVITELVLNHTSDQHPWFQRARRAKAGSPWRDFYVWSDTPKKYREARIIFQDFELSNWSWDPVAQAYYWHRFYAHQPDLNYDNPRVLAAIRRVVDFWLSLGVDGLRLDAVPYLIEAEGTPSENLPRTHAILQQLRRHVDRRFTDRMLLAEANQWPEDAAAYFGRGIARLRLLGPWGGTDGVLYDAMWNPRFVRTLLSAAVRRRPRSRTGPLQGTCTLSVERAQSTAPPARMPISPPRDESNTTVVCGGWGVLKLFRRIEAGTNPDLEIGRFLTARGFAHTPPLVGALEHHQRHRRPMALALVQRYVPHDCDAWEYTLKRLRRHLARARSSPIQVPTVSLAAAALLDGAT
jgi:Alpha amylase, catalytic domain